MLDNAHTQMTLTQDCLPPLIESTTRHYNSTCMQNTNLWLVFLTSVQQGIMECTFVAISGMIMHCHAAIPEVEHLFTQDTIVGTNSVIAS